MSLVLEALRLIGLDVPAALRNARAAASTELALARDEVRRAAWRASMLALLTALAAAAAICLAGIALVALYLWVSQRQGIFAGLGADASALLVMIGACVWSARAGLAPPPRVEFPPRPVTSDRRAAPDADTSSKPAGASASPAGARATPAALAALAGAGPAALATPVLTAALRQLEEFAEDPAADPLDAAASAIRRGDRKTMLSVLAGAALIGWMVGRSSRDHLR